MIKNKLAEALLHVQAIQARGAAAANRFRLPVPSESNQFVALKNDAKGCTITRSEMEGACRDLNMDRLRSELFGTLQNIELKENTTILQGSGKNNCSSLPVTDRSNQFVAAKDHFKITPNEIVGAHRDLNTNPLRTKPFGTRQSIELPEKMKILQGMGNGIHVAVPHGLIPARKRPRLC